MAYNRTFRKGVPVSFIIDGRNLRGKYISKVRNQDVLNVRSEGRIIQVAGSDVLRIYRRPSGGQKNFVVTNGDNSPSFVDWIIGGIQLFLVIIAAVTVLFLMLVFMAAIMRMFNVWAIPAIEYYIQPLFSMSR